jgi:hypothetical protein
VSVRNNHFICHVVQIWFRLAIAWPPPPAFGPSQSFAQGKFRGAKLIQSQQFGTETSYSYRQQSVIPDLGLFHSLDVSARLGNSWEFDILEASLNMHVRLMEICFVVDPDQTSHQYPRRAWRALQVLGLQRMGFVKEVVKVNRY